MFFIKLDAINMHRLFFFSKSRLIEYHYIVVKYRFLVYFLEDNGRLVFLYQFFTPSQKDGEEYKDPEEKGADGSRYRDPQ